MSDSTWSMGDAIESEIDDAVREAMPKWQPIETAPNDGTQIIAYCPRNNVHRVVIGRASRSLISGHGGLSAIATHWMPLPEPPDEQEPAHAP